jgi:hypothetical protein
VLIVSDGRQNAGAEPLEQVRRLASNGVRVFTVALGSSQPIRDAAVESLDAPDRVLSGDEIVFATSLRFDGIAATQSVTVELRRDGRIVQQRIVPATQLRLKVSFTDKPDHEGTYQYDVVIQLVPGEATTQNNRQSATVVVTRDKLKVLLIDDQPRWEYQFLRNYLARDHRIELTALLLSPARVENVASPGSPMMPGSRDGWSKFDVVILGDVPPEPLTRGRQSDLAAELRDGKVKGLMLIAGPRNMPGRFAGGPLAELSPVELAQTPWNPEQLASQMRNGFTIVSNGDSPLTRFSVDQDANDAIWAGMPPLFWHAAQSVARPGATVLWSINDSREPGTLASASPRRRALLATMRYGSGRVLYLASPETWRLRYVPRPDGEVDDLHQKFWGQAIRWASAGPAPDQDLKPKNLEERNLNSDPRRLAAMARAGKGIAFAGPAFGQLAAALPHADHIGVATFRIGLFDDPRNWRTRFAHWSVLILFIALITAEWVLRKRGGLA